MKSLIDALMWLNIALVPFLMNMWSAYTNALKNSARNDTLALLLDQSDFTDPETAPQNLLQACYDAGYTGEYTLSDSS